MAGWKRFEEMEVWKKGCRLACRVYRLSSQGKLGLDFGFRDHIRRSAISIPSNIAEGFERNGDREFVHFLSIAKGSSGELRTQIYIAAQTGLLDKEKARTSVAQAEEVSRMLAGLIRRLKRHE